MKELIAREKMPARRFPAAALAERDGPPGDRPLPDADVHALVVQLAALTDRVAVLERRGRGRADDDRELMRTLIGCVGAAVFSAAELRAHAAVDHDLCVALRPYPTTKRIGKRLRALAGHPVAGVVLRRVDRDTHGIIWGLQQVPAHLHAGAGLGDETGQE